MVQLEAFAAADLVGRTILESCPNMPWSLSDHIFITMRLTTQNFQSFLAHVVRLRNYHNVFQSTTLSLLTFYAQILVHSHCTAKRAFVLCTFLLAQLLEYPQVFAALKFPFGWP